MRLAFFRARTDKSHPPLKNPGIFTVQRDVAEALETTGGDLLGETGYEAARELISTDDRSKLRQVVQLLSELFDLDDESLNVVHATESRYRLVVGPDEFIEHDHDYPRTLHAWVVPTVAEYGAGRPMEPNFSMATTSGASLRS